jgi:hypothetical protein
MYPPWSGLFAAADTTSVSTANIMYDKDARHPGPSGLRKACIATAVLLGIGLVAAAVVGALYGAGVIGGNEAASGAEANVGVAPTPTVTVGPTETSVCLMHVHPCG